jgi:hypothetical protein
MVPAICLAANSAVISFSAKCALTRNVTFFCVGCADVHFVCGFETVRPLMMSKNNGDDVLAVEPPFGVCALEFTNT